MTAKPICVIYFPEEFYVNQDRNWIYQYMRWLNGEQSDGSPKWGERQDYWDGYYWFCFYKNDIQQPEFKVFFEKDFDEIKFEELKKIITDSITNLNA